jgi:alpha-glucosidase (family GH31 glycosyl hydrolase)
MVAPADVNVTNRTVYFPVGADWVDFWNTTASTTYHGGTTAVVQSPKTTIPVFQQAGSVVMLDDGDAVRLRVVADARGRDR